MKKNTHSNNNKNNKKREFFDKKYGYQPIKIGTKKIELET